MKKVELLAPAGSFKALEAAIASGADAVYIGGNHFGARAYAKNFDNDQLIVAIKFVHLYHKKIYITVNTLIYDHEFSKAMNYIDFLYQNDVDAVIVQDLGLMNVIREIYPDLEVHASTQMSVHNIEGVRLLQKQGLKRVVLARENTLDEISEINNKVNIETEVFVHGALCVSYSGQCLMSSLIGGRSGNRGRCAQPCRKLYDLENNEGIIDKNKYLISPKDLNTINQLDKIIDAGVTSLKLEGRMKSPEYVAIVVSIYRKAIDQYYKTNQINLFSQDLDDLTQIFNREFTQGFIFDVQGTDFINTKKNNNSGLLAGMVVESTQKKVKIKCLKPLHVQDGIYFENTNSGLSISSMTKKGNRVLVANVNDVITIDVKTEIKNGTRVFKSTDKQLMEKAAAFVLPTIPIHGTIDLKIGHRPILRIEDDLGHEVIVDNDFIIEKSKGINLTDEKIMKQLNKTKDTPFEFKSISINKDQSIFITLGALNELRRNATEQLISLRQKYYHRSNKPRYNYEEEDKTSKYQHVSLSVYCHTVEQVEAAFVCQVDKVYVNEEIFDDIKDKDKVYLVSNRINHHLKQWNKGAGMVVSNLGSLNLAQNITKNITSNFNLNVTNSETIKFLLNHNVDTIALSYEMNEQSYKNLLYQDHSVLEVIVYGYQESMITKYLMPIDEKKRYYLIDAKKEKFPVMNDQSHMHIYNSKILSLSDELWTLMDDGYKQFRLQFLFEDYQDSKKIIKAYQQLIFNHDNQQIQEIIENNKQDHLFTRGYYNREIL